MKEFKGEWYLPDNAEKKYSGILKIDESNNEVLLEIYSKEQISKKLHGKLLLGTSTLTKITLLKCQAINEVTINSDLFISRYSVNFCCIGCHFNSKEDIKFRSISFNLSYLDSWLDGGLRCSFKFNYDNFSTEFIKHKEIEVNLNDECNLIFERQCSYKDSETNPSFNLEHFATFTFNTEQIDIVFFNQYAKIKHFLTLCTGKPILLIKCLSFTKDKAPIRIYSTNNLEKIEKQYFLNSTTIPISFRYLKEDSIISAIRNWFTNYDKFESVYDIFFHTLDYFWKDGSKNMTNVFYQNSFLNLAQALEGYHKIKYPKYEKKEFNDRKQQIIQNAKCCLSQDDKQWIQEKAKAPEDYSYKDRICKLIEEKKNLFVKYFGNDIDTLINNIKEQRNQLSHVRDEHFDIEIIINVFEKMQLILYINILNDLGFNDNEIEIICAKHHKFNNC